MLDRNEIRDIDLSGESYWDLSLRDLNTTDGNLNVGRIVDSKDRPLVIPEDSRYKLSSPENGGAINGFYVVETKLLELPLLRIGVGYFSSKVYINVGYTSVVDTNREFVDEVNTRERNFNGRALDLLIKRVIENEEALYYV